MDWKYLFTSLEGRIGRQSYWMGVIAMTVITIVAALVDVLFGTMNENGYGPVSIVAALALIYPAIVLYAKRWHDRDKSGWWTLIGLVPVIGGLMRESGAAAVFDKQMIIVSLRAVDITDAAIARVDAVLAQLVA